ncbi:hypothetical protein Forpe1208_v016347 [Fusarium oxysporum f. sp. rapae]|uniref:Uncharacterized protein n=1 Tax=Fusarium oxysporum f. sp. rapae TaxID=485398 RepID=A0A8J5NGP9_FUSOX|nr:hypothetical protein Forpe1208_v016347 [Fusarium oxysporum f. sp. rapae]
MRRESRDLDLRRGHDPQREKAAVQHQTPRHVPPQERVLPQPAVALLGRVQNRGEHLQPSRDSEQAYHHGLGLQRHPKRDDINRREPEIGQVPAPALGNASFKS